MTGTTARAAATVAGAALLGLAGVADAGSAARYEGTVEGAGPVSFRTTKSAVKSFAATVSVVCVNGEGAEPRVESYVVMPRSTPRLGSGGRFAFAYDLAKEQGTGERSSDVLNAVKATVTGRVKGRTASGTAKVTYSKVVSLFDVSSGSMRLTIMVCSSGEKPLAWTARRR